MHKLQHKVASCVCTALGSTKTARKPLNCPKQKQNSQLSLQKLPPNLSTINSQQKHQLPTKLSSPRYFIKSQLPPKWSAPNSGSLWLLDSARCYPFSICIAVVRRLISTICSCIILVGATCHDRSPSVCAGHKLLRGAEHNTLVNQTHREFPLKHNILVNQTHT